MAFYGLILPLQGEGGFYTMKTTKNVKGLWCKDGSLSIYFVLFMTVFSKLFKHKPEQGEAGWRVGGMEDFMMLIRVYYQAVMASNLGINNLAALPDLRVFKQTLRVQTVNNKLGLGEKNKCKKMLMEIYGMEEYFFKEIDMSIKRHCRNVNEVRNYLFLFQGFSQELMMLMGNLMKWKFRLPGFLRKALRELTARQINDVLTKTNWKDDGVRKACLNIQRYQQQLGYSAEWMTTYVYHVVVLAKKEPKPDEQDNKK